MLDQYAHILRIVFWNYSEHRQFEAVVGNDRMSFVFVSTSFDYVALIATDLDFLPEITLHKLTALETISGLLGHACFRSYARQVLQALSKCGYSWPFIRFTATIRNKYNLNIAPVCFCYLTEKCLPKKQFALIFKQMLPIAW